LLLMARREGQASEVACTFIAQHESWPIRVVVAVFGRMCHANIVDFLPFSTHQSFTASLPQRLVYTHIRVCAHMLCMTRIHINTSTYIHAEAASPAAFSWRVFVWVCFQDAILLSASSPRNSSIHAPPGMCVSQHVLDIGVALS